MKRGWIVRVNLVDATPPEFSKTRPAVILSNDEANAVLPTVMVVPLTTRPPAIWPLRLEVPEVPGLRRSYAVLPGLRQVSKGRIENTLGRMPEDFMRELQEACFACLSE